MQMADVAKDPAYVPGTQEWSMRVRKRARMLAGALDTGYMELAEILWKVYSTPRDGDPNQPAIFKAWGFETFAEYAEKELGLAKRRAERLRQIYHHVEHRLGDRIERPLKKRLLALGWTKVREIAPLLTPENAEKWIALGEKVSYTELTAETKRMRARVDEVRERQRRDREDEVERMAQTPAGEHEVAYPEIPDDPGYEEAEKILEMTGFDPEARQVKTKVFPLFEDQMEPVERALERAGELSQSGSPTHNLALICTDFLATNDFRKKDDPEALSRHLHRLEISLGVKLIAVDPGAKRVVYGLDSLAHLIKD